VRAIVCRRYGGPEVLSLEEAERPVPARDEVLVRVRAASVNPMDVHFMRGKPALARLFLGLRRPKHDRAGVDMAGEVEAVGADVTCFRPGDAVFGPCRGAFADFACAREDRLAAKPAGLSFEAAAAIPVAGLTALQGLRKGGLKAGQKVLVIGAGGGIGTFAVQLARHAGASVTGVCSTRHLDLVRSLGAGRAVDYTREDILETGGLYDLVFDLAGTRSFGALRRILAPDGIVVAGGMAGARASFAWMAAWGMRTLAGLVQARFLRQKFLFCSTKVRSADLAELAALAESGAARPAIGGRFALADAAKAVKEVADGHAEGKMVIIP
jgi:NADPH:quinone reductase-like Zn-dependent oxidoreductase